jgi:hypothetical protein
MSKRSYYQSKRAQAASQLGKIRDVAKSLFRLSGSNDFEAGTSSSLLWTQDRGPGALRSLPVPTCTHNGRRRYRSLPPNC